MGKARRTLLHVGGDKTGSTAIQSACDANRRQLLDAGVIYPKGFGGCHPLVGSYAAADPKKYIRNLECGRSSLARQRIQEEDRRYTESVKEYVRSNRGHTVVISYEGLCTLDPKDLVRLKAYTDSLASYTSIIMYFRDPFSYARSAASQLAKTGRLVEEHVPLPNVRGIIGKFEAVFGSGNCNFISYNRHQFPGGDVRRDFLLRAGLERVKLEEINLPSLSENPSLTSEAICVAERLSERHSEAPLLFAQFYHRYGKILESIGGAPFALSPAQHASVEARSDEDIRFLRERGLIGDGDPPAAAPVEPEPRADAMRDAMRSVADVVYELLVRVASSDDERDHALAGIRRMAAERDRILAELESLLRRPERAVARSLSYRMHKKLSRLSALPASTRARFARAAEKRRPGRAPD